MVRGLGQARGYPGVVNLSLTDGARSKAFIGLQNGHGGLEIDQPGGPAGRDFVVDAPFFDVPVLVDMGGGPDLVGIAHAVQQRQRQQRRAGQRRHHMQRRDRPGISGENPRAPP